jgi:hypothetical protein
MSENQPRIKSTVLFVNLSSSHPRRNSGSSGRHHPMLLSTRFHVCLVRVDNETGQLRSAKEEEAKRTWSDVFSRSDKFQDSRRNKDTKSKTDTGGSFANSRSIIKAAKR